MSEQSKQKYLSMDRITHDDVIKKIQQYINNKYELSFEYNDMSNGSFVNSEKFKSLDNEIKRKIIFDLHNFNYSFSHVLLSFIKNIIEAKERYKDESWYQYDVNDFIRTGLIDGVNFDEKGNIIIRGIIGTFTFSSLCNSSQKDKDLDDIVNLNQYQPMCFSNAIDILETKKIGNILLIKIANAQNSFLHAVYLNDNTIYDLNYFITYSYEQLNKLYNFQVIKSLDYDVWQKAKQEYSYTKPESLLVSIGISDTTSDTQQMIEFLDSNNNFNSRKK